MKLFLSRLFSSHPLAVVAALCLIPLTVAATRWAWMAPGASERAARGAADVLATKVVGALLPEVQALRKTAEGLPEMAKGLIDGHATRIEAGVFGELRHDFDATDALVRFLGTQGFGQISAGWTEIHHIHQAAQPAIDGAARLENTYAALPGQLGAKLGPSWAAIEPEITCQKPDAFGVMRGYGGCWHARITAVMGEAARVGGTFAQNFPALSASANKMAASWAGISEDVHTAADKYLVPHPAVGFWANFKLGLKMLKDLALAWLRGGGIGL